MEINDKIYCVLWTAQQTFIPTRTINFLINFNEFIQSMFCFGYFCPLNSNDAHFFSFSPPSKSVDGSCFVVFVFYFFFLVVYSTKLLCCSQLCLRHGLVFAWLTCSSDNNINNSEIALHPVYYINDAVDDQIWAEFRPCTWKLKIVAVVVCTIIAKTFSSLHHLFILQWGLQFEWSSKLV